MTCSAHDPLRTSDLPSPAGPYVHPCEHEGGCFDADGRPTWGAYGFKAAGRLRWWCDAHQDEGLAWMQGGGR